MNSVIRKVSRVPLRAAVQRRGMAGGHHGPPPTYTGLEAKVRKFLPENHHMAMGYIGLYTGLYLVSKMLPKSAAPPTAPVVASSGDMPSADSAEFGEWIGQEGNLEKLFSA